MNIAIYLDSIARDYGKTLTPLQTFMPDIGQHRMIRMYFAVHHLNESKEKYTLDSIDNEMEDTTNLKLVAK